MENERCCCNCLHCARWHTSKGIECHCDLTDRYLNYLMVMDTDNNCCRWEKETKWDIQAKHDNEIYNKAIADVKCVITESTIPRQYQDAVCRLIDNEFGKGEEDV